MLTLTEASKLIQNPLQRGVVETFARTGPDLVRITGEIADAPWYRFS